MPQPALDGALFSIRNPQSEIRNGCDGLCDDERLYYTTDANQNVTALVESDGDVVERYVYDPYGQVTFYQANWQKTQIGNETPGTLSAYSNAILFGGYYRDGETGLYNVRNRYYHVQLGWLTRDPLGYVDGMGLYEYVQSGPCGKGDPLGLQGVAGTTTNFGHNFDLVVLTATDAPQDFREDLQDFAKARAKEIGGGTTADDVFKSVTSKKEFEDAVKNRYDQVNKDKPTTEKRCLRVLVVGHGNSQRGPYVGRAGATPAEQREGALLSYPAEVDPAHMMQRSPEERAAHEQRIITEEVAETPMGKVKGMVGDVTFINCNIAGDKGAAIPDTSAKALGMHITAPQRVGKAGVVDTETGVDITFTPKLDSGETPKSFSEYIHHSKGRPADPK
jgi:RHS repeat-associated protein